jgi:two-component system response regulator QseB
VRILILADESRSAGRRLAGALAGAGYGIEHASAATAGYRLRCDRFDAVVFEPRLAGPHFLPRMLRDEPGLTLIAWLPTSSSTLVADLLAAGADEVLDGTMASRELAARVLNAARHDRRRLDQAVQLAGLRIVPATGEASWNGRPLRLSRRERDVLQALAEAGGRPVPRELLYRRVWGYAMARGDRSVDVNVKRLRDKLALAGVELEVRTETGVGYGLTAPRAVPAPAAAASSTIDRYTDRVIVSASGRRPEHPAAARRPVAIGRARLSQVRNAHSSAKE